MNALAQKTEATPKERPILFSGAMVRAILDGRKTQTRRVVKPQPYRNTDRGGWTYETRTMFASWTGERPAACALQGLRDACPYGAPGDRLWVRETWAPHADEGGDFSTAKPWSASIYYCTDGGFWSNDDAKAGRGWSVNGDPFINNWRPSIHMPRWASRLTLEITDVRVERLGDISEEDARAEGCHGGHDSIPGYQFSATPTEHFRDLWKRINGTWNPSLWVWVVSFRRLP